MAKKTTTEKVNLTVEISEEVRRAAKMRALMDGKHLNETVEDILRDALEKELTQTRVRRDDT